MMKGPLDSYQVTAILPCRLKHQSSPAARPARHPKPEKLSYRRGPAERRFDYRRHTGAAEAEVSAGCMIKTVKPLLNGEFYRALRLE
jgi:hypothetical protein